MSSGRQVVVIVDDEKEVVASLRRTLRHEPYEVVTFTSAREALAHMENHSVDLLISDIDMPEMTGLELISATRKRWPHVARVLLTGDSSLESAVAAINEGAVHKYLTKPWSAADLRSCLREIIASVQARHAGARVTQDLMKAQSYQDTLEHEFPGFTVVARDDGAYILNDTRVVERLSALGDAAQTFRARHWLVLDEEDATQDLRGS